MVWVNIDTIWKTCTIHVAECRHVSRNVAGEGTPQFKGIGELKRDGGWFSFVSAREAENFCKQEWECKEYTIRNGQCCLSSK